MVLDSKQLMLVIGIFLVLNAANYLDFKTTEHYLVRLGHGLDYELNPIARASMGEKGFYGYMECKLAVVLVPSLMWLTWQFRKAPLNWVAAAPVAGVSGVLVAVVTHNFMVILL